jgi:hypothetical protein
MRHAADDRHGYRLRGLIVVLWRAGLRVHEALDLAEQDLDHRRGSVLVRSGKGGRRREVGMDEWGWEQLRPWLGARVELPVGPLFCVIDGRTRGRPWAAAAVRSEFRRVAARARVRRRFAPHQLRHAHALELAREGCAAKHHPAPARARKSRHHIDLPARDRPGGDHHRRAHTARADDVRQRRTQALKERHPARQRERPAALPLRPGEAAVPTPAPRRSSLVLSSDEISHDAGYRSPRESARPSFLPSARRRARPVPGEVPAAERKQDRPAPLDPVGRRRRSLERRFRGG